MAVPASSWPLWHNSWYLVLVRAGSEKEHFKVVDTMLDDLEARIGVPRGSDLDDAQVASLKRFRDRLAETVPRRVENF